MRQLFKLITITLYRQTVVRSLSKHAPVVQAWNLWSFIITSNASSAIPPIIAVIGNLTAILTIQLRMGSHRFCSACFCHWIRRIRTSPMRIILPLVMACKMGSRGSSLVMSPLLHPTMARFHSGQHLKEPSKLRHQVVTVGSFIMMLHKLQSSLSSLVFYLSWSISISVH